MADLLSRQQLGQLQGRLNDHFGVEISRPRVRIIRDPEEFFNLYQSVHRDSRSIRNLISLNNTVECYYDDKLQTLTFKGFRRDGSKSFKRIRPVISLSYLVHEWIHHLQHTTSGYGQYDFFDEACAEFVTYVLTGEVNMWSVYWNFIVRLWNFLDCITTSTKKKYILIRDYCVAENKKEVHDQWLDQFLNKHKRIKKTRYSLVQILEEEDIVDAKIKKILYKKDHDQIREIIYRLRDRFKLQ